MQRLSLSAVTLQNQALDIKQQVPPNVSQIATKVIQVGNGVLLRKGLSEANILTVTQKISQQFTSEIQPYIDTLNNHQNNCLYQSQRMSEGEEYVKLAKELLNQNTRRVESFLVWVRWATEEIQKANRRWEEDLRQQEQIRKQRERIEAKAAEEADKAAEARRIEDYKKHKSEEVDKAAEARRIEEHKRRQAAEARLIEDHKKRQAAEALRIEENKRRAAEEAHRIEERKLIEALESKKAKAAAESNIKVQAAPIKKEESKAFKVLQLKPIFPLLDAQKLKDQQFWVDFYKNIEWKELDTEITIQNSIFKGDGVESDTFRATTKEGEELLIKIPKNESCDYEQYIQSRKEQQLYACFLASCFRKALYDQKVTDFSPLFYAPPITFQVKENQKYKNRDVLYAEPLIQQAGFEFLKYTTNGAIYQIPSQHMTIFTHYTFHVTQKLMVLSDLQGVNNLLTDPCFHSKTKMLTSETNGRLEGMRKVLSAQHSKCDQKICTALGMEGIVKLLPGKIDLMSKAIRPNKVFTICEFCCQQTETILDDYRIQEQVSYDMDCPILCNRCAETYRQQKTKQCECCGEEFKYLEAYYKELKLDIPKVCLKGCILKPVSSIEEPQEESKSVYQAKQHSERSIQAKLFCTLTDTRLDPFRMAFSGNCAYVINRGFGSPISKIYLNHPQKKFEPFWFNEFDFKCMLSDIVISENYAYVTDRNCNRICRISLKDPKDFILDWATSHQGLTCPTGIAISGHYAYVCNSVNDTVSKIHLADPKINSEGAWIHSFAGLFHPEGISVQREFQFQERTIHIANNDGTVIKFSLHNPSSFNLPLPSQQVWISRGCVQVKYEDRQRSTMILVERGTHESFGYYVFQENGKYLGDLFVIGFTNEDLFIRSEKSSTIFVVSRNDMNRVDELKLEDYQFM